MNLRQLRELKPQIEHTKSEEGLGVGEKEFAWVYEPGKPIKRLKEIESPQIYFLGGHKHCVIIKTPLNTNAVAKVHNHPTGEMYPNYSDIKAFLNFVEFNPRLRFSLAAATEGGIVSGYYVMTYRGRCSEAQSTREKIKQVYVEQICKRLKSGHPEKYNLPDWEVQTALMLMEKSDITGKLIPIPGYKPKEWGFVKIYKSNLFIG